MSNVKKPIYCWDTSVFLAWLNEEASAPLADIAIVAQEIDAGTAVLIVPVTIASEILESKLTPEQKSTLELFLKRSNVVVATTTLEIARKAGEIRDAGLVLKPARKIKTPDATIVATALIYGCDALHSLDDRGNGALRMHGMIVVGGLVICKPVSLTGQKGLSNF